MSEDAKREQKQGHLPLPATEAPPVQHVSGNVARLPSADRWEKLRILEAVLFAAPDPLDERALLEYFTSQDDIPALLEELQNLYTGRGVNLMRAAGKWAFRTAPDLSFLLERISIEPRRLSKAALETLAIIAYHQPVTRAEIEEVRGVSTSKGTLDVLLEMGWIRLRGRRRAPGRPVTYGTTDMFLDHFGFDTVKDLPGLSELKGAGLLDSNLPPGFSVPEPTDLPGLLPDEDPLDDDDSGEENLAEAEEPLLEEDAVPEENDEETRPQVFDLLRRLQG
ncbi:MAG: SMC-Scp complex subunit ScpB [Hyphomicrobiales bacterium]|nr:SMC-Scp complex subunit ScpB [Hyphomicrobiales bacterium]